MIPTGGLSARVEPEQLVPVGRENDANAASRVTGDRPALDGASDAGTRGDESSDDIAGLRAELAQSRAQAAQWQRSAERAVLLASASARVASSNDVPQAMRRLGELLVPQLADWCLLDRLTEGGDAVRVAVVHRHPARVPADAEGPLPALRQVAWETGSGGTVDVVLPQSSSLSSRWDAGGLGPDGSPWAGWARVASGGGVEHLVDLTGRGAWAVRPAAGRLGLLAQLGAASALVLPLRARGRTFGVLTLCRDTPGSSFSEADIELLADAAGRASLALDGLRSHVEQRQVAEVLQRAMLSDLPDGDDAQSVARYRPAAAAAEVGGDWYDAFALSGGALAMAIGDVAGHDLQAAHRMGQLRSMLRALAWDRRDPPSHVLGRLDDLMQALSVAETATCVYALLEPADDRPIRRRPDVADDTGGEVGGRTEDGSSEAGCRVLRWASAGHPPPLLITPTGRAVLLNNPQDLMLGVNPGVARVDLSVILAPESTVVLYTDGLVESRGQDLDVGLTRLRQVATALAGQSLPALADGLMQRLGGTDDDVALLAIRLPPATPQGLAQGSAAALRPRGGS